MTELSGSVPWDVGLGYEVPDKIAWWSAMWSTVTMESAGLIEAGDCSLYKASSICCADREAPRGGGLWCERPGMVVE